MHGLCRKFLLSLASLVLFVLLVEGLFRLLPAEKQSQRMPIEDLVIPDSELIWRLKPHQVGPYATNELGLRDTPYNHQAEVKILLLGDSVAWGDGIVDLRRTFPWLLEQRLSNASKRTVEVINSAVPGYSTFQEFRYLQLQGLQFKPDLIMVQFCLNDVVERYSSLTAYGGDRTFIGIDTRHAVRGLHGWLLFHSRAYETGMRLAVRLARNRQAYQVEKLTNVPLSRELTEAWQLTLAELDQIREVAAANNIPMILLAMPYRFQLERPEHSGQPQQVLQQWAASRNIPIIDLLPRFAAFREQYGDDPLYYDPSHLHFQGHELTAEFVAAALLPMIAGPELSPQRIVFY